MKISYPNKNTGDQFLATEANEIKASNNALYDRSINVDDYGAIGDGVTDDTVSIQSAIDASSNGDIVEFTAGKTYLIEDELFPSEAIYMGYGATIKRADAKITTTSSIVNDGDSIIPVVDASVFKVGDNIIITDSTAPNGGIAYSENSSGTTSTAHTITDITGNNITINNAVIGTFGAGENVFKVFTMFLTSNGVPIEVYGLTLDGNKANNGYTVSWVFNNGMGFKGSCIIQNCRFYNIPSNALLVAGETLVTNNIAKDVNGSFVHQSAVTNIGNLTVSNNVMKNIGIFAPQTEHGEAAITFSAESQVIIIANNHLDTCGGALFGNVQDKAVQSSSDKRILVTGNRCNDIAYITTFQLTEGNNIEDVTISNNQFINFGYINVLLTGNNVSKGGGIERLKITNNIFKNGYFDFSSVNNLTFANNKIKIESNYATGSSIFLRLYSCLTFNINNNTVEDASGQFTTTIDYSGANFAMTTIKTDASTATNYLYYGRNSKITGNILVGCINGIVDGWLSFTGRREQAQVNMDISGNTIQMSSLAAANIGILALPGTKIENNIILGDANTYAGIYVTGQNLAASILFNGAIVIRNTIKGIEGSIRIANGSVNGYNMTVIDNITDRGVIDLSGGNSVVAGNIVLPIQEAIPLKLPRENTEFY